MSDASGVKAVAEAIAEDADELEPELDLLDVAGIETERGRAKVLATRGPGRPKGARNKRQARTVAMLMASHVDPRARLLSVVDMHPADLAAVLGCSLLEAVQEQRLCALAVLPYVAQRQPLAVDITQTRTVFLTINEGVPGITLDAQAEHIAAMVGLQEFQEVSDQPAEPVGQNGVGQDA